MNLKLNPSKKLAIATAVMGAAAITPFAGSLAGCGSGSANPVAAVATSRAANLNVYMTDGFTDQYSHVLVTLYGVSVSTDGGKTYTTVYSNTTGATVDLASLSTAAQLLSSVTLPTGTITNVQLTFANAATLDPSNGSASTTVTLDPTAPNVTIANNEATITLSAPTTVSAGKLSNLVLDFKLSGFELVKGALRPSIGLANPTSFQGDSKIAHLSGTVANLAAGSGFTLDLPKRPNGVQATVAVTLSATTVIADGMNIPVTSTSSGATTAVGAALSVAIANGDSVVVDGTVDPTTGTVSATSVLIVPAVSYPPVPQPLPYLPGGVAPSPPAGGTGAGSGSGSSGSGSTGGSTGSPGEVSAIGTVGTITSSSNTFTLQVQFGDQFPSPFGAVTVDTNSSTVFQSGNTVGAFSSITANESVAVIGTFDPSTGTIMAQDVIVLPSGGTLPGGVVSPPIIIASPTPTGVTPPSPPAIGL